MHATVGLGAGTGQRGARASSGSAHSTPKCYATSTSLTAGPLRCTSPRPAPARVACSRGLEDTTQRGGYAKDQVRPPSSSSNQSA
eukprot:3933524-Rhodomonas_salina.3